MKEGDRIDALDACRNAIDGESTGTKIGEVEANSREAGHHLLKDDSLGRRELYRLWEEHLLRKAAGKGARLRSGSCTALQLLHVTFIADADISPVLVDDHQSRLDGSHDIAALVLVMQGREVGRDIGC